MSRPRRRRRQLLLGVAAMAALLAALVGATPASAQGSWWRLSSSSAPTYLPPGGKGTITVTASNLGDESVSGDKRNVILTDTLPAGLEATQIQGNAGPKSTGNLTCDPLPAIRCVFVTNAFPPKGIPPFEQLTLEITVKVSGALPSGTKLPNNAKIEGGEAEKGGEVPSATLSQPLTVNGGESPFGVEKYSLELENAGGSTDTQAASHPFQLTTTVGFNETLAVNPGSGELHPAGPALVRDLHFTLPPGLIGNPTAVPRCAEIDFFAEGEEVNFCPGNTAVGVARVTIFVPQFFGLETLAVPVFNLVPGQGEPARFGFSVQDVPIVLDTAVKTGSDYGVVVSVKNASEAVTILGSQVTFWGVPGDAVHDQSRGWECVAGGRFAPKFGKSCSPLGEQQPPAFLTLPTSCMERPETTVTGDSWPTAAEPKGFALLPPPETSLMEPFNGCERIPFSPSISVEPEQQATSTPTALKVDVHLPQQTTQEREGLGESAVKDTTVTLPAGVQLSPSAANGLQACSEGQVGFKQVNPATQTNEFTPSPAKCPNESKVGVVHIKTPDLPNELEGGVYLAEQTANPFGSLFAMYIVAEDPVSRVLVKLAGEVQLDENTGQVTTVFKSTPQVPFEDLRLELFGGPRASVTTPPLCGTYTTTTLFNPWSGTEPQSPSAAFSIGIGAEGAPCSNPLPLAPGFAAGTTNTQAGSFTPFSLTITRPDGDQAPSSVSMRLPSGLAAMLSSVTLCPEPQASQGTCGPDSLIGKATVTAGLGSQPFTETGGKVFITGPYNGAPFGLSVVVPTVAGPFDFGNVVTRSTLNVDRNTAAVTIDSALPTMVNTTSHNTGVPVQLKQIHVVVDRPNFQFNPTNCTPMKIDGTLRGSQGGAANLVSYFQVANCSSLPFKPTFTASTQAKTSKANGASLTVKVTSGPGQANIGKTSLILPVALPSRLTTIQKACVAAAFEANPASCPEGSNIGTATVHTPVLKNPLTGPAFLVSHGSAKFPDVEFVLQGEGITLILDGQTDIKKGITSSTFNALPDAPVSTFETTLPEGPHSALAANGNLCAQKLTMPTTLTGQNGTVVKQITKIGVTGCPRVASPTRAQLLAKALKVCKKKRMKAKRVACEKQARKKYGAKKANRAAKAKRR